MIGLRYGYELVGLRIVQSHLGGLAGDAEAEVQVELL